MKKNVTNYSKKEYKEDMIKKVVIGIIASGLLALVFIEASRYLSNKEFESKFSQAKTKKEVVNLLETVLPPESSGKFNTRK